MIHIGIDTGTHTGVAVWDSEKSEFLYLKSTTITLAMERVAIYCNEAKRIGRPCMLHIEDARLRKWFGQTGREKLQGAGAVKRDARIWEDWCKEKGFEYVLVAPKNNRTKLSASQFNKLTGWHTVTSEHSRDAACLVFGL